MIHLSTDLLSLAVYFWTFNAKFCFQNLHVTISNVVDGSMFHIENKGGNAFTVLAPKLWNNLALNQFILKRFLKKKQPFPRSLSVLPTLLCFAFIHLQLHICYCKWWWHSSCNSKLYFLIFFNCPGSFLSLLCIGWYCSLWSTLQLCFWKVHIIIIINTN